MCNDARSSAHLASCVLIEFEEKYQPPCGDSDRNGGEGGGGGTVRADWFTHVAMEVHLFRYGRRKEGDKTANRRRGEHKQNKKHAIIDVSSENEPERGQTDFIRFRN